jgi:hypothetical protein
MLAQTSGMRHIKTRKKVHINTCPTDNSRGNTQQRVDLSLVEFYLWGHLKSLLYSAPIENEEIVHQRIFDGCQTMRNRPGMSESMRQSLNRRIHVCIDLVGGHFEHLL